MKLTNISLAVLVALGLVACGGSDDNNNQTTDPKPPKEIPGDGGNGGDGGTPPKGDKSALVPSRQAPDLTVAPDAKNIVDSRKRVFIDRGFSDSALGYEADGVTYDEFVGTDPADVKLTSIYNFRAQSDTISDSVSTGKHDGKTTTGYTDGSVGAIFVGTFADAKAGKANAFVKVSGDKYARVKFKDVGNDEYTPKTKFVLTDGAKGSGDADVTKIANDEFSQSQVVFIANAIDSGGTAADASKDVVTLGKYSDKYFNVNKGQVVLRGVTVFGTEYSAESTGENLNFGSLAAMREIQTADVTGTYEIRNNKNSAAGTDDKTISKSITLGKIKAYNLPYSIALVTTNVDDKNPDQKNIFNLPTGAFQVRGYETPSLPREGRAHYYGKSFNASVVGDVELIADFAADRTGISGTIFNRKDHAGTNLPALSLEKIQLTDPDNHNTNKAGKVTGQSAYADAWSVTIFGPEAEEAAGMLYKGGLNEKEGTIDKDTATVKEVYNTQRKELTNVSNNDSVK